MPRKKPNTRLELAGKKFTSHNWNFNVDTTTRTNGKVAVEIGQTLSNVYCCHNGRIHSIKNQEDHECQIYCKFWHYTVKLACAKLPANAGNFTCTSQVKRSLAQFTCVTCSLPVITGKFTCFEAASTSRRTHAHCLRAHVNLPEYHRYFTGSFTCGTQANLPATSMQNCLLLQAKIHAKRRQKYLQTKEKIPAQSQAKKTCNFTQNYLQLQAICHHTAGKFTCKLQVS